MFVAAGGWMDALQQPGDDVVSWQPRQWMPAL
jgi:hypothetical protein